MFFYPCSQWSSCFSNVDTFTVLTWYLVNHFYRICTAVRPHTMLRHMLVHPKDRINDEKPEVVYKIPCKNCECVELLLRAK